MYVLISFVGCCKKCCQSEIKLTMYNIQRGIMANKSILHLTYKYMHENKYSCDKLVFYIYTINTLYIPT